MKNFFKILLFSLILCISSLLINDKLSAEEVPEYLCPINTSVSSIYFNDEALSIWENNCGEELSQSGSRNSNSVNTMNKYNFAENLFTKNYIYGKLNKLKYNNKNYIASTLENIIYTRAP